ncbi:MAG TPA: tetrahydrofolate dehydrogenase/cyclohydrolase catalytic domain-containing protein, partial [Bacteroidota bacterium]|nr:tetrahydrofolate dehydrogenase/cyclohydrolase catalytic domain-containing protein [Bacteroidota bacterium]
MAAMIIDGRRIAEEIKAEVHLATQALSQTRGITPGLAFILVGDNPSSEVYVRSKGKACQELGFHSITEHRSANTSE